MDQTDRHRPLTLDEHIAIADVLTDAAHTLRDIQLRYPIGSPAARLAHHVEDHLLRLRYMLTDEVQQQLQLVRDQAIQVYAVPRRKRTKKREERNIPW